MKLKYFVESTSSFNFSYIFIPLVDVEEQTLETMTRVVEKWHARGYARLISRSEYFVEMNNGVYVIFQIYQ